MLFLIFMSLDMFHHTNYVNIVIVTEIVSLYIHVYIKNSITIFKAIEGY